MPNIIQYIVGYTSCTALLAALGWALFDGVLAAAGAR